MKTPLWEESAGALAALINTGQFVYQTLYTITLFDGTTQIKIADGDFDVTYPGGGTYSSKGVPVDQANSRATAHWKRGLDLDTWLLIAMPRVSDPVTGDPFPDKIGDTPWVQAAREGALDGADIQIDRAYFASWPQPYRAQQTPVGVLTIFAGTPAEVDTGDCMVAITINDYRELLLRKIPQAVYSGSCRHTLFDAGCTLSPASFAVSNAALTGSSRTEIVAGLGVPGGSGDYSLGKVLMTSGANAGFSRTIREWTNAVGIFYLLNPFPFDIEVGDAFTAYPGCDKSQTACTAFGNLLNFGGQSYIPEPETAL